MTLDPLEHLGRISVGWFWGPLAVWTAGTGIALLLLGPHRTLQPLLAYRLRQGMLLALPLTVGLGPQLARLMPTPQLLPTWGTPRSTPSVALTPPALLPDAAPPATVDVFALILGAATLWVALLALRAGWRFLGRLNLLRRLGRLAVPVTDPGAIAILEWGRSELGVEQRVDLLEGPPGTIPMTFGWRRPRIVVCATLAQQPERLRMAVAHELIHVRRGDAAWAVIEGLIASLGVAHPLVPALAKAVDRHRESSCDAELVARGIAPPGPYARLLYELGAGSALPLPAPGLAARHSNLTHRLETMRRFANKPESRHLRPLSSAAGAVACLGLVVLSACSGIPGLRSSVSDEARDAAEEITSRLGPMADETREAALERLDVQMAYLRERVEGAAGRIDELERSNQRVAPHVYEEYQLLNQMYLQRLETYETLKMERETEIRLGRSSR